MPFTRETGRIVYKQDDGTTGGEITYAGSKDGVIIADHTFVDSSLRGQGIAGKLLDELAALARENGWKIRPQCSYVVSAFARNPEKYQDIRA